MAFHLKPVGGSAGPVSWATPRLRCLVLVFLAAFGLHGCGGPGRVAVILDNSASMGEEAARGAAYSEVKDAALATLTLIPRNHEIGLRVFNAGGSEKVADYSLDREQLRRSLAGVELQAYTKIGPGLRDAAQDLASFRAGSIRLFLITDGLGNEGDLDLAREARDIILKDRTNFACTFLVFNASTPDLSESIIGQAAKAMGCTLVTPGALSSDTLRSALSQAVTFSFFPLWLLVSGTLYVILAALTASMVFQIRIKSGDAPRAAMTSAGIFLVCMWVLVIGVHGWWLFGTVGYGAAALLGLLAFLVTAGRAILGSRKRAGGDIDPF